MQLTLDYQNMEVSGGKARSHLKCLEQFDKFNKVGSWSKMYAKLLIGQESWFSMNCKLTWKLRATKLHRFYFQLVPQTEEDLLPTPTTQEPTSECKVKNGRRVTAKGGSYSLNLGRMMGMGLLPTPTTMTGGAVKVTSMKKENTFSASLHDLAKSGLLPTPVAGEWRDTGKAMKTNKNLSITIAKNSEEWIGEYTQLNPQFVMEMMGFPTDWTLLPFLNKEITFKRKFNNTISHIFILDERNSGNICRICGLEKWRHTEITF